MVEVFRAGWEAAAAGFNPLRLGGVWPRGSTAARPLGRLGGIFGSVLVLVYSYYSLAPPAPKGTKMRTTIAVLTVLFSASLLGGCAGAGLSGSTLPGTASLSAVKTQSAIRLHGADSFGGLPGIVHRHRGQGTRVRHQDDSIGGLPGARVHRQDDSIGGLPGKGGGS